MHRLAKVACALALLSLCACSAGAAEPAPKTKKNVAAKKQPAGRGYPPKIDGAQVEIYKTVGDVKLNIYIFSPPGGGEGKRPAIVFFFGGGWRAGSPAQFTEQCRYLASRGMVAMTADYRVSSRHGTKAVACVADAKSAIRWVRSNAARLGVDPQRIVAAGGSAGGHIAACTGVVSGLDELSEDKSISSVPNAMVLFNPALALAEIDGKHPLGKRAGNLPQRLGIEPEKISPYHHVEAGQAPAIIFFGTNDGLLDSARSFQKVAKEAGNRCELLTWKGLPHGFFNHGRYGGKPFAETLLAADKFLISLGYLAGKPTIEVPE